MIIKNYDLLINNSENVSEIGAKKLIPKSLDKAVMAADPKNLINDHLKLKGSLFYVDADSYDLSNYERIYVIGAGKASGGLAEGIEAILKGRIVSGLVNIPRELVQNYKTNRILLHPATHPLPSIDGVEGTRKMLDMVKRTEKTLVICLISGGGSALLPLPKSGITLDEKMKTTELLLKSGADIFELNTVRKHLSDIKGGQLVEKLYPSTVIGLIISDVVGDDLGTIASGPLSPDLTTYFDAYKIIKKYNLLNKLPPNVITLIENGIEGKVRETPKPGDKIFNNVHAYIIGNNATAVNAAKRFLESNRIKLYMQSELKGDAYLVGSALGQNAEAMAKLTENDGIARYIIAGGETTVKVLGSGKGGRNQHAAAAASLKLHNKRVALAFMGTDGIDGPTDAAGALADYKTVKKAGGRVQVISYIKNDDSYELFKKVGGLIITGYTGTNVNDVFVAVSF